MSVKKGQILDLSIEKTIFGGQGLCRVDGLAVFVEKTAPGDKVKARIVRKKKSFALARVEEILEPSPVRVQAPCPYSGMCGGCKWQFIDYKKQLEYKGEQVAESLHHIGGLENVPVHPTMGSELIYGYRNKMEFSCSDHRWLLPDEIALEEEVDRSFALGLHVPGTFHKVMDIEKCLLQTDDANDILQAVHAYMKDSPLPAYGLKSHEGFWRFAVIRHSVARDEYLINIVTSWEELPTVQPLADALVEKFPKITAIVNNITDRKSGVAVGDKEICLKGQDYIMDSIGPWEYKVSANSFFQTNTRQAKNLYQTMEDYADLKGGERVLDLYSGAGAIPIWLSPKAGEVLGIEIVEVAVADARDNCERNKVNNCTFLVGDILETLDEVAHKPDVLVIDPPRSGMHGKVVKKVMAMAPSKMVYISCNPTTLARDLELLSETYSVEEVQPIDMFPHTHHIEAVARLVKK
ncbi:RNA methyltransferase, TrmA family [Desulfatibacillum aliphaticivorans]|uniref:RNA methyltransferase, TrmA family n=1 Tax=Desulfatibacillum aliphaticivorans TaxID=218208 RepID=B8FDA9_DESAL|nr:23S rRNA (uracil(1939)-C(5))-methyltransferase RlmD [Desulfatibacillum aliphaticivorans]ACL06540.1 RNA methyltransferase, TrmA family [Desulfatibacillum aliphaticivorans]